MKRADFQAFFALSVEELTCLMSWKKAQRKAKP
jgi:hypothetical protein